MTPTKPAKARGADIIFIDTAGRLHTKTNLMEELGKINRVLKRLDSNRAPSSYIDAGCNHRP